MELQEVEPRRACLGAGGNGIWDFQYQPAEAIDRSRGNSSTLDQGDVSIWRQKRGGKPITIGGGGGSSSRELIEALSEYSAGEWRGLRRPGSATQLE
ncbi:unnamed protein product [Calypogeia fissa]